MLLSSQTLFTFTPPFERCLPKETRTSTGLSESVHFEFICGKGKGKDSREVVGVIRSAKAEDVRAMIGLCQPNSISEHRYENIYAHKYIHDVYLYNSFRFVVH